VTDAALNDLGKWAPFAEAIEQFLGTVDGLRELLEQLEPHVDVESDASVTLRMFEQLPVEKREALQSHIGDFITALEEVAPSDSNSSTPRDSESTGADWKVDDSTPAATLRHGGRLRIDTEGTSRTITIDDPELADVLSEYVSELVFRAKAVPKGEIFRRSLLAILIAAFEMLVVQLVTHYYRLFTGALDATHKEFSLSDLRSLASIEDAEQEAIARRVDTLMAKGIIDWQAWFKANDIDLTKLATNWDRVVEIFHRRHVIVHAGGRVTRRYLSAVAEAAQPPPLHAQLLVSESYLREAIDDFVVLGTTLTVAMWHDFAGDDVTGAVMRLYARAQRMARHDAWASVRTLCNVAQKLPMQDTRRLGFNALDWLARKKLDGQAAINDEVETWDVSALSEEFAITKLCLLGRVDEAAKLVPRVLKAGKLSGHQLREQPLFGELREHGDVAPLITATP
jgi:hypothetical protein